VYFSLALKLTGIIVLLQIVLFNSQMITDTMRLIKKSFKYSLLLLLIGCSASVTETFQWTRFRGSNGQGIDKEGSVPVSWDSSDFQWKITLPGTGNASPVVWGNKIFVTSADDEKDLGYVMAVDAGNVKILWQKEFAVTDISLHNNNKLDAATPAVDEKQVYIIWYSKEKTELTALDHSGNLQWQAEFGGIESRHGGGSSLMFTDKYVIFTREQEEGSSLKSSWVAVDKLNGETVWELERESAEANSFATPLLVKTGTREVQLIFGSQAHGLTGVDPGTGHVLWERKELLSARVVASPIFSEGLIIIGRKGETLVIEMDPNTGQAADSARYSLPPSLSPYVPTPIVVDEFLFLFMDNGTVACLHLATGELLWKERPAGDIFGSPVCIAGNLYCITKAGKVLVIDASSAYQLLGIHELGEGSFSTPVMCGYGMVFRTFSQLMLLGNKSW
jgi:outer membrane protein assembly factor BamB